MTQAEAHLVELKGIPVRTKPRRIGMIAVLIEIMEHDALLGYDWAHGNHEGQHPRPSSPTYASQHDSGVTSVIRDRARAR